jgi:hypothetical protein
MKQDLPRNSKALSYRIYPSCSRHTRKTNIQITTVYLPKSGRNPEIFAFLNNPNHLSP